MTSQRIEMGELERATEERPYPPPRGTPWRKPTAEDNRRYKAWIATNPVVDVRGILKVGDIDMRDKFPERVMKPKIDRKYCLYRHFDKDGILLYVGISEKQYQRNEAHRKHSIWFQQVVNITVEHYQTREECEAAEKAAIKSEKPLHNKKHVEAA